MEVKVFCQCGSKYKFDVEPVNERMPWPVNCPACGADGTTQANEIIAQTFAANPPAPAPSPLAMSAPPQPAMATAPAPISIAPAPAGLRINKQAPAPAAPPPIGAPPPVTPPRFTPATTRPLASSVPKSSGTNWTKIGGGTLGGILAVLVIGLKIWRIVHIGHSIYNDTTAIPDSQQLIAAMQEAKEMNLVVADNNVVLYVKHDDYHEVAQDCLAFWKEKGNRDFQILSVERAGGKDSEYQVYPAHNGYVCVLGGLDGKDPMFESTAQHLSQKYNTLVFDQKDVDDPGEFIFGAYDQGSNVFRARMAENKNGNTRTKVEHVEWAKAHGYKPGSHGDKDFDLLDANILTKNCGMKFWDQPIIVSSNYLVLATKK